MPAQSQQLRRRHFATWPRLALPITKGKTLYFSHGFLRHTQGGYKVVPPKDVDVILVKHAYKELWQHCSHALQGWLWHQLSIAGVWQDVSGKAKEKAIALGVTIGSGYMYETTFEKEVYSNLYRCGELISRCFGNETR